MNWYVMHDGPYATHILKTEAFECVIKGMGKHWSWLVMCIDTQQTMSGEAVSLDSAREEVRKFIDFVFEK